MSGKVIPDFEVAATGNQRFASAAFKGHPYIVYFYPKDDTPGCTVEGSQFRDLHKEFLQAGFMVFDSFIGGGGENQKQIVNYAASACGSRKA